MTPESFVQAMVSDDVRARLYFAQDRDKIRAAGVHPVYNIRARLEEKMRHRKKKTKPRPQIPSGWIAVGQAIAETGLIKSWIYDGIQGGDIEARKGRGGKWYINPVSLQAFAEKLRRISGDVPDRIERDGKTYVRLLLFADRDGVAESLRYRHRIGKLDSFKMNDAHRTIYIEESCGWKAVAEFEGAKERAIKYQVAQGKILALIRRQPVSRVSGRRGRVHIRAIRAEVPDVPHATIREFMRRFVERGQVERDSRGWYRKV